VPAAADLDPAAFTLELRVFVANDCQNATRAFPWLACKGPHEEAEGHFGLTLANGRPQARINVGGGRANAIQVDAREPLGVETWHHLAASYDGDTLRLWVDGRLAGERKVGRPRVPGHGPLVFGRRGDNGGDGYHFRGVIDEIRFHHQALLPTQWAAAPAARAWSFQADGTAMARRPRLATPDAAITIRLRAGGREWHGNTRLAPGDRWSEAGIAIEPAALREADLAPAVRVDAGTAPVAWEPIRGWHRIGLDGARPVLPAGAGERRNDALQRTRLTLENPGIDAAIARLMFEQTRFHTGIGAPITGLSAILRDSAGRPTGLPVQISKNWHNRPEGGAHAGHWFHGFSLVRLPPHSRVELELAVCHGHWGGLPAASHAQLSLIGWGSNQLWDQSALGAWGESICYEPDRAQADCLITDVRPLLVAGMKDGGRWQWTHNVGGGDWLRLFAPDGSRVPHARMRTAYERVGPCLTEVTYAGRAGPGIEHQITASLARGDDLTRGVYRLRMEVREETAFSRLVIFQIGADTYSYTGERKFALGDEHGLQREWATRWGGDANRGAALACTGPVPWISLHEAVPRLPPGGAGAWANRGLVIREWRARLGGREAGPWLVEHGTQASGGKSSTADLVPPPGVDRLVPGDFLDAVVELLVLPRRAEDYYGPNEALRRALAQHGDTWRMIHREAAGNRRAAEARHGTLLRRHPDLRLRVDRDAADLTLAGGTGFVPLTFTGLTRPDGFALAVDGQPLDQSVHGNDYWQADHDATDGTWSLTFNVPAPARPVRLTLARQP
jgi:hypothetical protein